MIFYKIIKAYKFCWKCAFINLFCANLLLAQSGSFEHISVSEGLSQGMAFDILQDKEGFIWVATKYGLNRYDGTNFKTFLHSKDEPYSIATNQITALLQDSKGRIWIGTGEKKIIVFEPKTQRFYYSNLDQGLSSDLPNNLINAIYEDDYGNVWFGSSEGQILKIETSDRIDQSLAGLEPDISAELNIISIESVLGEDYGIYSFSKDSDEQIMAFSNGYYANINIKENTVSYVDIPENSTYDSKNYLLTCLFKKGGENLFLTNKNVFKVVDGRVQVIDEFNFKEGYIIDMDASGDVWGIKNNAIFKTTLPDIHNIFEPTNFQAEVTKNARIKLIRKDSQGNFWLATNGYGIVKIRNKKKRASNYLERWSSWQVYLDSKGNLYSWDFNRLFKSEKSGLKVSEISPGVAQGALIEAKDGTYWKLIRNQKVSPNIYLEHLDENFKSLKIYDFKRAAGIPYLRFLEDHKGNLVFVGFSNELIRFNPSTELFNYFNFSQNFVFGSRGALHIYEDVSRNIWVSGESGLLKITPKSGAYIFTGYNNNPNNPASIPSDFTTCAVDFPADPENFLLIGTHSNGILKLHKHTEVFESISTEDGLPSNNVAGIIPESEKRIWLSSNLGVVVYDLELKQSKLFNAKDGLISDEFNMGSFFKGKHGQFVFGGIRGVSVLEPSVLKKTKSEINLKFVDLKINNKSIRPFDESNLLKESIEYTPFVKLSHDQNNIGLEFTDLNKGVNRLKYRLLGASDSWVEMGPGGTVNYTMLPPGNYSFELTSSSLDFGEGQEPLVLNFEISPPWYWNWMSILVYALITAFLIYLFLRGQRKQIRLEQEVIYNAKEKLRLSELDELKSNFFTNVSHELKTPLTLIEGPINELNKKYPDEGLFKLIKPNVKRLRQLMYQILDVQKLEAGKVNFNIEKSDLAKYFRLHIFSFESLAASYGIKMEFKQNLDEFHAFFDKDKFDKIIDNLISNAIKYNFKGGTVRVKVVYKENPKRLTLSVSDTGQGISETDLPQIFDRFFQVNQNNTEGTGVGLSLVKELVSVLKGTIDVESVEKEGTTFLISMPIDQETWKEHIVEEVFEESIVSNLGEKETENVVRNEEKELLLLVEDNPDMQEYLKILFQDRYDIIQAFNGAEGIEKANKEVPDLIVCDLMMPIMDGFEFSKRIRANAASSHVPIIMLTAKSSKESRLESLEIGIDLYMTKPFDTDELSSAIKSCIDNRKALRGIFRGDVLSTEDETKEEVNLLEKEFINKVKTFLEQHYHDSSMNVGLISDYLGMSETQLRRKLKSISSYSPNEYLRKFRLEKAEFLLKEGDKTVSEIAFEVGYESLSYFSRIFQQEYGCLPSEYVSG
ncbi:ATP-binding protein [uncultured Arcticibacterium sp.]|uniref:hybrid sensor histidine kinase/response regulator transcription factor n=1 Tax=uncultured Arcticibacterium sp. TaxID=2173042 RepID=UPI0030FA0274